MASRWNDVAGDDAGRDYAARMDAHVTGRDDVHGEADLVADLAPPGGRVLDAGCGTGRVAIELVRRGFVVVGTDLDDSMLAVARKRAPELAWQSADLATLDLDEAPFDVVVAAGNVVPLLAGGTEADAVAAMASHLRPGGLLIAGFGLDPAHLPLDDAPVSLADYDGWCHDAGLVLDERVGTWERDPFTDDGYAVSIHHRPATA